MFTSRRLLFPHQPRQRNNRVFSTGIHLMFRVALKMLIGDRVKYAGLVFGITFTSFLVTFASSYFTGFMTQGFALIAEDPRTDVWVMDPAVRSVAPTTNLPASA